MSIPIIDTHQHLIYPERYPYGWAQGIPALQDRAFRIDDYRQAAAGTGISATIFMETSPDDPHHVAERLDVLRMAEDPAAGILGVIASCRPEEPEGFEAFLDAAAHPKLCGLRRILHVVPDDYSTSSHFVANLRLLARRNLTFDMCFLARQLPLALQLARQCEEVQFVLDHCGVPNVASGEAIAEWRGHIVELAKLPNVACKISGVMAYCDPANVSTDAVRPYVEHCLEQFGWDRVVWGGDWPVCLMTTSLAQWVASTREIIAHADPSDQRKLLHDNALRIYGVS